MSSVLVFITMDSNESHKVMEFQCGPMRSIALPLGAVWIPDQPGYWTREATDATIFAEIAKSFPAQDTNGVPLPQPVSYKIIEREELPQDREFRDAWEHDGTTVRHNMPKARTIHLAHLRQARVDALGKLDREWMRATGQGKKQEVDAIEAQRQVLRDLPATLGIAEARTVDELKGCWPAELPPL